MIFTQKISFESPIFALFDEAAKLGKASGDAYNWGRQLILYDLLNEWVAKGVASGVKDFNVVLFEVLIHTIIAY